jgi:hypothetical protein
MMRLFIICVLFVVVSSLAIFQALEEVFPDSGNNFSDWESSFVASSRLCGQISFGVNALGRRTAIMACSATGASVGLWLGANSVR